MASELAIAAPPDPTVRITNGSGSVRVTGEDRADVIVSGASHAEVADDGSVEVKARNPKTLAQVAQDQNVDVQTVIDAMVAEATAHIDQEVQEGELTAEEANEGKANLQDRITRLVNEGKSTIQGPRGHGPKLDAAAEALNLSVSDLRDQLGPGSITVRCPEGSDVIIGDGRGDVELDGRLGRARVTVRSGSISVENVDRLDARTGSGSFEVSLCVGECRLKTGSGSIRVGRAGSADLATGSGTVAADLVDSAKVKAGSGNVDIGLAGVGNVDVKALSGSVMVTVPRGTRPATRLETLSGRVERDLEVGEEGEVRVKTLSGSIRLLER